jgi:hypothetical protein
MSILDNIYSMVVNEMEKWQNKLPNIKDMKDKTDNLLSTLEKTKNDYITKTTSGDTLRVDFKRMTDADLSNIAKNILSENYSNKKNSIESDYAKNVENLEDNLNKKVNKVATEIVDIDQSSTDEKNKSMDKAMKNNIARSSTAKLTQEEIDSQANAQKGALKDELETIKQKTQEKIDNASNARQEKLDKVEQEYEANLIAKENDLKNLKESDSEYVESFVDKRQAQKYSDDLVKLVMEFAKSVPNAYAKHLLDGNSKLKEILTQDEIEYIKKMIK